MSDCKPAHRHIASTCPKYKVTKETQLFSRLTFTTLTKLAMKKNTAQKLVSLAIAIADGKPFDTMPIIVAAVLTTFLTAGLSRAEVANSSAPALKIAQAEPSFVGKTWEPDNKRFRVQFFKKNNTYNGKVVGLPSGAETKDVNNPDPKLRSRNLIGSTTFQGFTYDPTKKQLTGGVLYIPAMGRIVKPKLSVVSDDRIEMTISLGIIRQTVVMTPVK
jgi:Uncharacterized protein conserved in bacteria (DUF2147)